MIYLLSEYKKSISFVGLAIRFTLTLQVASFLCGTSLQAQENTINRIPKYKVAYTLPNTDSIKSTLDKIRVYYEATSSQSFVDSKTGETISDYLKINPNALPSSGFSSEWSYTHGVVLSAFDYITKVTGDQAFFNNNLKFYNYVIKGLPYLQKSLGEKRSNKIGDWGRIMDFEALDDCGSITSAMIKTYQKNKNEEYLTIINRTAEFVTKKQFRLADGTLARRRPQYESVWADDMYMSVPFLANMGVLTGDKKYVDDAVRQVLLMAKRLYVPKIGLFDHGWNVTSGAYDPHFFWARANGWTVMAMAELLSVLPEKYKGRDAVLKLFRLEIQTLANLQDGDGFWHNLLDKNDSFQETSATAMFTYAIAKGINEGWISHVYGSVAIAGWNAVQTQVLSNGSVDGTCEGTTFANDNVYYYNRGASVHATHGYGPVLYAGAEMINLLKNDKFTIQKANPGAINSTFHFILKTEWTKNK